MFDTSELLFRCLQELFSRINKIEHKIDLLLEKENKKDTKE